MASRSSTPRSAAAPTTFIEAARNAGGQIKRIALTHGHGDHVGSLDALKQKLGNTVEVLMPDLDARIHAGEKVTDKKPPGSWPKITTKPDVRLTGGERIGSLEVVLTPGHTPGHVSFLDTRDRTVIVGDTLTSIAGLAVSNHSTGASRSRPSPPGTKPRISSRPRRSARSTRRCSWSGTAAPSARRPRTLDKAIARAGG